MTPPARTDIILPMSRKGGDHMAAIVDRSKTHEFRRVRYPATVQRIWFYETAPISAITYVCEVELGSARPPPPASPLVKASAEWHLPEGGSGNTEFNGYHPDWTGYDYAYTILSCWRLRDPVTLERMKTTCGFKGPPRGMVYAPEELLRAAAWLDQVRVW